MAGFLEELLSGKYPQIERLWRSDFARIVDEVFSPKPEHYTDDIDDDFDAGRADAVRLEDLLRQERSLHDRTRRELEVARAERDALRYKLDAVRKELST